MYVRFLFTCFPSSFAQYSTYMMKDDLEFMKFVKMYQ